MAESITIDVTPTWGEVLQVLITLIERGDHEGQQKARAELQRMARLADIASVVLGADRRPDARVPPEAAAIVTALQSWRDVLDLEDGKPAVGTAGAKIYARANAARVQLDAVCPQSGKVSIAGT